jgi:hypothetical protein
MRMGLESNLQMEVAGGPAAKARAALPCQAQMLPSRTALGMFTSRPLLQRRAPLRVGHGHAKRDGAARAAIGVFQVDEDLGVVVAARGLHRAAPRSTAGAAGAAGAVAEQGLEEVAEVHAAVFGAEFGAVASATELVAGVPAGRRLEILPALVALCNLVVGGAGDVIVAVNNHRFKSLEEFDRHVAQARPAKRLRFWCGVARPPCTCRSRWPRADLRWRRGHVERRSDADSHFPEPARPPRSCREPLRCGQRWRDEDRFQAQ